MMSTSATSPLNCIVAGGVGCRSNSECPAKQACQNKKCVNPCGVGRCLGAQNCEVTNHVARCVDGEYRNTSFEILRKWIRWENR